MSSFLKVTISMITVVLIAAMVIPAVSAEDAEAPTWQVGDVWAYGDKVYLEPATSELIESLEEALEQSGSGSLDKAYINGSLEAYTYCRITSVTSDECVMEMYFAVGFDVVADIRAVVPMSVPGTYDLWDFDIPTEDVTVTVQANADVMVFEKAVMTFDKQSMALKSIESLTSIEADVSLEAKNVGEDIEYEGDQQVITRAEDIDVNFEMDLDINTMFEFSPYLDILDFPIVVGEEWTVYSEVTGSGNVTGTLEAYGLPEGALEDFIQPEVGIVTLPLDFSSFTGEIGDMHVENGQLDGTSETVSVDMMCNSMISVEDAVNGDLTVYEIYVMGDEGAQSVFYYSPELSMFSSMEVTEEMIPSEVLDGLPIGLDPEENLAFGSMDPEDAAQGIYDVSGVVVSDGVDTSGGDDDGGFDTGLLIMVGAVAALVIIILAFVLIKRKK